MTTLTRTKKQRGRGRVNRPGSRSPAGEPQAREDGRGRVGDREVAHLEVRVESLETDGAREAVHRGHVVRDGVVAVNVDLHRLVGEVDTDLVLLLVREDVGDVVADGRPVAVLAEDDDLARPEEEGDLVAARDRRLLRLRGLV